MKKLKLTNFSRNHNVSTLFPKLRYIVLCWQLSVLGRVKIFSISKSNGFEIDQETNLEQDLIMDVLNKIQIVQKFYINLYKSSTSSFHELLFSSSEYLLETISNKIKFNWTSKDVFIKCLLINWWKFLIFTTMKKVFFPHPQIW